MRARRGDRRGGRGARRGRSRPAASSATRAAPRPSPRSRRSADAGAATFSLHPLQTVPDRDTRPHRASRPRSPAPTPTALGVRPRARRAPRACARSRSPRSDRAAYHAAAAIASNFLVALEESAASCSSGAGVEDARELLAPLVLRTAANWAERGAERAHRADRPRRRGDGRRATSRRSRDRARARATLRGARRAHPRDRRAGSGDERSRAPRPSCATALAAARRDGPHDRAGADDGRPARRPPVAARAPPANAATSSS